MKWGRLLAVFLAWCWCSLLGWAQVSGYTPASTPSAASSTSTEETWNEVNSILDELSKEVESSNGRSQRLEELLAKALSGSKELSGRLEESRTLASGFATSLKSSAESLKTFADLSMEYQRKTELEILILRGAVVALTVAVVVEAFVIAMPP